MNNHIWRRGRMIGALGVVAALTLSACGGGDGGKDETTEGSGDEKVTIKFSWWGSDARHEVTQKVIDEFEAAHPNINVEPDYTSWDNYFEKLNVAAAGNDLPDVITQEERFLAEYAARGLLADLSELGLDTSKVDDAVVASGKIDDHLYGIATGINVHGVVVNKTIFDDLGIALPDDTTWTWDDYSALAAEVTEKSGGEYTGVQNYSFIEVVLKIIARQHGEEVFTPDGKIGVSEATVEEFFQRSVDQIASGAEPDASVSTEVQSAGVEGSLPATNKGAMAWFWSNQLPAITAASGQEISILRAPGESQFERSGQFFKPAMYYSVSAKSKHPEEAKLFVDFLVNSTEAGELILTDRGLPANLDVREAILPKLGDADKMGAEFATSLEDVIVDGPPVPPVGSGETSDITSRINSDVIFGKITPADAARQWIEEVGKAIS